MLKLYACKYAIDFTPFSFQTVCYHSMFPPSRQETKQKSKAAQCTGCIASLSLFMPDQLDRCKSLLLCKRQQVHRLCFALNLRAEHSLQEILADGDIGFRPAVLNIQTVCICRRSANDSLERTATGKLCPVDRLEGDRRGGEIRRCRS